MKTQMENIVNRLIATLTGSTQMRNELIPQLIPVRVITNRVHRENNH
jgi:hypothetical protein